ncbi:hypothetical protein U1Q18_002633 [Sarracenia purpurea var. burkii]
MKSLGPRELVRSRSRRSSPPVEAYSVAHHLEESPLGGNPRYSGGAITPLRCFFASQAAEVYQWEFALIFLHDGLAPAVVAVGGGGSAGVVQKLRHTLEERRI